MAVWQLYREFLHEPDTVNSVTSAAGDRLRQNFRRLADRAFASGISIADPAFGAVPGTQSTDNIGAINAAMVAASAAGIRDVIVPSGLTFYAAPSGTSNYILPQSNVRLCGGGTIRVKDNAGNYQALFYDNGNAVSNFTIENVTIDQNPVGNTTADIRSSGGTASQALFGIYLTNATDVTVRRVRFPQSCGVNTVKVSGTNCRRVTVENSFFQWRRGASGQAPFYDNTLVYLQAPGSRVLHNFMCVDESAGSYQSQFANGGIEIHAPNSVVNGNFIDGIMGAIYFVTADIDALHDAISYNATAWGNVIRRANKAYTLIAANATGGTQCSLRGVTIGGGSVGINQVDHDRKDCWGVGLSVANTSIEVSDVHMGDFNINFQTPDTRSTSAVEGVAVNAAQAGLYLVGTGNVRDVSASDVRVKNSPLYGVAVASSSGVVERVDLNDMHFTDCGLNTSHPAQANRSAINLGGGTSGNLTDVTVKDPVIVDTGPSALNGLSAILALNGAGTQTRVKIKRPTINTASGLPLPMVVDNESGLTADDGLVAVTYASSWSPDLNAGQTHAFPLNGNVTVANATGGLIRGRRLRIIFTQDATGSRTVTWNAAYKGAPAVGSAANTITAYSFTYNGSNWIEDRASGA